MPAGSREMNTIDHLFLQGSLLANKNMKNELTRICSDNKVGLLGEVFATDTALEIASSTLDKMYTK